jgi:PAS domain S-box-containing protein
VLNRLNRAARIDPTLPAETVLGDLIRAVPCAALVANDAGAFVLVNEAAVPLTGYSRPELLRLSVWQITPGVNEREAETLWRAFLQQREQIGTYSVLRKDRTVVVADYAARAGVLPGFNVALLRPGR